MQTSSSFPSCRWKTGSRKISLLRRPPANVGPCANKARPLANIRLGSPHVGPRANKVRSPCQQITLPVSASARAGPCCSRANIRPSRPMLVPVLTNHAPAPTSAHVAPRANKSRSQSQHPPEPPYVGLAPTSTHRRVRWAFSLIGVPGRTDSRSLDLTHETGGDFHSLFPGRSR